MYDSAKVSAMMKATIQKCFSENCREVRGSKGLDHSTFGAAGDESEGDDLYIVIRDVMTTMIIWVAPRIIFDFSPHMH